MNAITVLVLTRPSMRSPVNVLLCAVAVCDIVVMSSYLVFVIHFLLAANSRCEPSDFSYGWALFMMFHAHASVIFHAASIWMTVGPYIGNIPESSIPFRFNNFKIRSFITSHPRFGLFSSGFKP